MRMSIMAAVLVLPVLAACASQQPRTTIEPAYAPAPVAPAPIPVPVAPPPVPSAIALVDIGGGVFCPPEIAQGRRNMWGSVGRHPYEGTPEEAVETYKEVPAPVRSEWLRQVNTYRGVSGVMELGDTVCGMLYTVKDKHKRWNKVESAWKDKDPRTGNPRTELSVLKFVVSYGGFDWVLVVPPRVDGGCDNWSYKAVARGAGAASFTRNPAQSAPPQPRSAPKPEKPAAAIPPAHTSNKPAGLPKCPDNLPAGVLPGRCS